AVDRDSEPDLLAGVARAAIGQAITVGGTGAPHRAAVALAGTAAIDVDLVGVLDAVGAGGRDALARLTHAAHAVGADAAGGQGDARQLAQLEVGWAGAGPVHLTQLAGDAAIGIGAARLFGDAALTT